MNNIVVLSPDCVAYTPVLKSHSAFGGLMYKRILGNTLEVYAHARLASSIGGGVRIAHLPEALGYKVTFPAYGEIYRYTSDADQTPDIRRVKLAQDGYLYNANSFSLLAGQLVVVRFTLIDP